MLEQENNNTEQPVSLHSQLAQQTEHRPETQNGSATEWDFNFSEKETQGSEPPPGAEPGKPGSAPAKVTDEVRKTSAETSTMLFDGMLTMVGGGVINHKFKKKFSAEEMKIILERDLEDKELEQVEAEHQLLKKKFDRLLKKRDRKAKAIPLTDDEHKTVYESFYNYYKVKNIAMPPEMLLIFTLGGIMVNRTLEITMD